MEKNEPIYLVLYINISLFRPEDVPQLLAETSNNIKDIIREDNAKAFVIPTRDEPTRFECINPKLVTEEEYTRARKALEHVEKSVNNFIEEKEKSER